MGKENDFDTLVVVTASDFKRVQRLYGRLVRNLPGRLLFVGNKEVGDLVEELRRELLSGSEHAVIAGNGAGEGRETETSAGADICRGPREPVVSGERGKETENPGKTGAEARKAGERIGWIDEDSLLPFDEVHALMTERLSPILMGRELPRKVTGWYYQQFLKMQYALICEDEYYMVWDGDTIPCREIRMFQEGSGAPYFDLKTELHEGYFETLGRILPGMRKVIGRSFISEHMLFKTAYMREMIAEIEKAAVRAGEREDDNGSTAKPEQANDKVSATGAAEQIDGSETAAGAEGKSGKQHFWEKILYAIPSDRLQESDFSEFETYGTYCALRHMGDYALREWHSFRLGGEFFDTYTISERDFAWLSRDFDAISFEKGHTVREDHRNLFDNPAYQEKLSPRQMLESIQDLFNGGYVEVWGTSGKQTGGAE